MDNNKNIITEWLDKNGDPEIENFIAKNLAIVDKVHQVLEDRSWSQAYFAKEVLKKSPSEVSKWLSGMHNLTLKSIIKMETALGIDLVHTEPKKEYEYVFLGVIESQEQLADQGVEYQESSYALAV
jgi:transcriptional regulator with XRE-family HTH domain